ncbi:MAG: universal stress protein [Chloroflexi bacterium]|nr:universal stress protein [Chloroflexota bacterium]
MFQRILVPLDGSALSELAVPYAEALAGPLKSAMILLMVVPTPAGRSGGIFRAASAYLGSEELPRSEGDMEISRHPVYKESEMASLEAVAKSKLLPVAERLRAKGIEAEVAVAFGRAANGILQYARDSKVDLIVMGTHGEGGPEPFSYGATADRVARRSPAPVMLIRPEEVTRALPTPETKS